MDSMKPDHIIQENKAIPAFFCEYFMQENMAKLLDTDLEKPVFSNTQKQTVYAWYIVF